MIKGMTNTWSTRFWRGFFPEMIAGRFAGYSRHRAMLTDDSMTLQSKSIQRIHPIIICLQRMIKGMTST
jgi:hypothetical protein